jgi:hypothetical protein
MKPAWTGETGSSFAAPPSFGHGNRALREDKSFGLNGRGFQRYFRIAMKKLNPLSVYRWLLQPSWKLGSVLGRSNDVPVVLHITHHKAGSQWVANLLRHCVAASRWVKPRPRSEHFSVDALVPGAVIPTIYWPRDQVEAVTSGYRGPIRRVVVIRDLRDTLVSLYFSVRYSHGEEMIRDGKRTLARMDVVEGMRWLMDHRLGRSAAIQTSWNAVEDCLHVRYEDLAADEHTEFGRIFDYCRIRMPLWLERYCVAQSSFTARTGRVPGQEDIMSHRRKGIVGDWRNYFTEELKVQFKALYGNVLIETGYEKNLDW